MPFSNTPRPTRVMTSDAPPALTSGSGKRLVGIMLRTTLMFMNAWTVIIVVNPSATNAPKGSGACIDTRTPRRRR